MNSIHSKEASKCDGNSLPLHEKIHPFILNNLRDASRIMRLTAALRFTQSSSDPVLEGLAFKKLWNEIGSE